MKVSWKKYTLKFKFLAGTSRGTMMSKDSYFLFIEENGCIGVGECGPLPGLSTDNISDIGVFLDNLVDKLRDVVLPALEEVPDLVGNLVDARYASVRFGLEVALMDCIQGGKRVVFDGPFYHSAMHIPINGLIWMGDKEIMSQQLEKKLEQGFSCIKIKIGAIQYEDELDLVRSIRRKYKADVIEIRLDANGAFSPDEAMQVLKDYARYEIHSIEQPIRAGQWEAMRQLCLNSPIPIALDEELIGVYERAQKEKLLFTINPPYIILKPTLLGGFASTAEWIRLAYKYDTGWWVTSALESNIGLNAIAQFVSNYPITIPQGLGTGQLYHNNIASPLTISNGHLYYNEEVEWDFGALLTTKLS